MKKWSNHKETIDCVLLLFFTLNASLIEIVDFSTFMKGVCE